MKSRPDPYRFSDCLPNWLLCAFLLVSLISGCNSPVPIPSGDPDNGGLFVPDGFEAMVYADTLGSARHLAVRDNGDVYVKLRYDTPNGENVALRDTNLNGRADVIEYFGKYPGSGKYGTGMRIHQGYLYFSTAGEVYRLKLNPGELVPSGEAEMLLTDPYQDGEWGYEHIAKPLAFDNKGNMYVPFGAPSDICQVENRRPGSPGQDPCPELEWHGGVWQFDANTAGQTQADGKRYATGIRSIVAMSWNPNDQTLYALQHGRDNMTRTWPDLYSPWQSALLPSEEFLRIPEGADAGWPYYYYDHMQEKKLLNPEYGGDGIKTGQAAEFTQPLIGFPGHWAPNDLHFYEGDQFPERYKHGAFIAFHGSTIRAPYPQSGYFIGFVPFENGAPSGPWEIFADGFIGVDTIVNTSDALYRPMGIAMGPDGSLYISESEKGRIWRIVYTGDRGDFGTPQLAQMEARKALPHIKRPHETKDDLDVGRAVAGSALYTKYCSACHQGNGKGDGTRFPPLDESEWVTGDVRRLIKLVLNGLEGPIMVKGKSYLGVMPGHDYLEDEEIAQILTYIRRSFGNDAGPIRLRDVNRARRWLARESEKELEEEN